MKRVLPLFVLLFLALTLGVRFGSTLAQAGLQVTLPGTIQGALGAKASWDPKSEITRMNEVSSGVYEFVARFPKGKFEYKVAVGGTWDTNYGKGGKAGGENIVLEVPANDTIVRFVFNANAKTIMDSINQADTIKAPLEVAVVVPVATAGAAPAADGSTRLIVHYRRVKADYEKWNMWVWPKAPNGGDGASYVFADQDEFGKVAVIDVPGKHTELGFIVRLGDWESREIGSDRSVNIKDGKAEIWVFQGRKEIEQSRTAADAYLAQAAPPRGLPAFLDSADTIRAFMETPTIPSSVNGKIVVTIGGKPIQIKAITAGGPPASSVPSDTTDPSKVVVAGTIQGALGGTEWNPNGDISRMIEISSGVFEFVAKFPKGSFEYKIAKGGSWAQNWGAGFEANGQNIGLAIPKDGTVVKFIIDFNKKTLQDSINNPTAVTAPKTAPEIKKPVAASSNNPASNNPVSVLAIQLERKLTINDFSKLMELKIGDDLTRTIYAREVLSDKAYWYSGEDLGSRYSKKSTSFKVWSPVSSSVELFVFDDALNGPDQILDMKREKSGVWALTVKGDLHGHYYQYRFKSAGETRVAADINSFAASSDSKRSMVVDLALTNPKGFSRPKGPSDFTGRPMTESVLYEMHVRDFTVDPSGGVKAEWRGKYLGLTQSGTKNAAGSSSGLDYLKSLGVTDIHLLPIQNFNPANSGVYNWGYETNLFNVPEEQYSTTPGDPANTIKEVKAMVQAMHAAGLRVVMDVVYNHTMPAGGDESAFWQTVPYYYLRTDDKGNLINESGVGNAMNDERPMVRKYIRDSLKFWTLEYGIDGYRFDLVGMHTKTSVESWTQALRKIRPDVILYGEPWTGGGPTRFGKGTQRGLGPIGSFAVFNDNIRNAMRGDLDGTKLGFVMGGLSSSTALKKGIVGGFAYSNELSDFTDSPLETINYISAHDNLSFWDKLEKSMPNAEPALRARSVNLAHAMVLLSQGIPFLEGGVEMGRSKGGIRDSYNAGDAVNRYDWDRATKFSNTLEYYKGMIAIRRAHPAFRLSNPDDVRKALKFLPDNAVPVNVIAYTLEHNKDAWKNILVVLNGSQNPSEMALPAGDWKIAADANRAGLVSLGSANGTLKLEPLSAYVLYQ
jgi:pullulanase